MLKKNITLSAEDTLIQRARKQASAENTTLNELFRGWLTRYVTQRTAADQYLGLMTRLRHVQSNCKFDREELNERR